MAKQEIRSFRDLEVWVAAMDLVILTYGLARDLPSSEQFEPSAQMRRCAVSIPSNVAEGHARRGKAYRNHVSFIALGSAAELDTLIEAAVRLGLLTAEQVVSTADLLARVGQMLHGLARALKGERVIAFGSSLGLLGCVAAGLLAIFH